MDEILVTADYHDSDPPKSHRVLVSHHSPLISSLSSSGMNGITPVVAWRAYFIDLIEVSPVSWGLGKFLGTGTRRRSSEIFYKSTAMFHFSLVSLWSIRWSRSVVL